MAFEAFKSLFIRMYDPINLLHYLANECLLVLKRDCSELTEEEKSKHESDKILVDEFFKKIVKLDPDLDTVVANPDLIDDLLKRSKEIANRDNNRKNYYQSRGYSRGRGFVRRGDAGSGRGRFYDSRNQGGENKEWRANRPEESSKDNGARGDRHQNRDNYNRGSRYQRQRGQYRQYRGRDGGQNEEKNRERDGSSDRDENSRRNNRHQQKRGQYNRQNNGEGVQRNSETNWRQK